MGKLLALHICNSYLIMMNPGVVVGSEVKISHICRVQLKLKPFEDVVSDSHYNLSVSLYWNEINQHEDDH